MADKLHKTPEEIGDMPREDLDEMVAFYVLRGEKVVGA